MCFISFQCRPCRPCRPCSLRPRPTPSHQIAPQAANVGPLSEARCDAVLGSVLAFGEARPDGADGADLAMRRSPNTKVKARRDNTDARSLSLSRLSRSLSTSTSLSLSLSRSLSLASLLPSPSPSSCSTYLPRPPPAGVVPRCSSLPVSLPPVRSIIALTAQPSTQSTSHHPPFLAFAPRSASLLCRFLSR